MKVFLILFSLSFSALAQVDFSAAGHCHNVQSIINQLKAMGGMEKAIDDACKGGDGRAFYFLAKEAGKRLSGVAETNLLDKACDKGHSQACVKVSKRGKGEPKDKLIQACETDPRTGCVPLAIHFSERGNLKGARKAYNRSCQSGDTESCYMIGRLYEREGKFADAKKQHMHTCNNNGVSKSCLMAGKLANKGTKVDPAEVRFYMKKACDGGEAEACEYLKN